MSDTSEKQPVPAQNEPEKAPLSDKKKRALLSYMSILFCAAFILVLLSFLIQLRDSNSTISQLSQASTNAMTNAQRLQEDNSTLIGEVDDLKKQVRSLEEERGALEDEAARLQEELDKLKQELENQSSADDDQAAALEKAQAEAEAYRLLAELERTEETMAREAIADVLRPKLGYLDAAAQRAFYDIFPEE